MYKTLQKFQLRYEENSAKFHSLRFHSIWVKCHDFAKNNTINVFLKPEVYQRIPAVVKRIPPPYLSNLLFSLTLFRGAKYSSNLVTLPSVRWGLFIRGVSRLSFIVGALSFLPFPFLSFHLFPLTHIFFLLSFPFLSFSLLPPSAFSRSLSLNIVVSLSPRYQLYSGSYLSWINASGLAIPKFPLRRFKRTLPSNRSCGGSRFFRLCLSCYFSLSLSLPLSLSCEPGFPAYDASPERYRRKAGSRKRRITKWSVTAGVGHHVYSLSRSVYLLTLVEPWSSNIAIFASLATSVTEWHFSS